MAVPGPREVTTLPSTTTASPRFWVRGIPDPAQAVGNLNLDAEGRLRDLAQGGWRISVLAYRDFGGRTLPAKLFLNAGELQIRLIIDTWQIPQS